jgi:hypothetical protein
MNYSIRIYHDIASLAVFLVAAAVAFLVVPTTRDGRVIVVGITVAIVLQEQQIQLPWFHH